MDERGSGKEHEPIIESKEREKKERESAILVRNSRTFYIPF